MKTFKTRRLSWSFVNACCGRPAALLSTLVIVVLSCTKLTADSGAEKCQIRELCDAASSGKADIVRQLIAQHSDLVNHFDEGGWSALHHAATADHVDVIEELLKSRAKLDNCGFAGLTPLAVAARTNALKAARLLLQRGAAVNFQSERQKGVFGFSPLQSATAAGHLEMTQMLLEHGAKICPQRKQRNALHTACMNPASKDDWERIASPGNRKVIQLLIDQGANVNEADESGNTPLIMAVLAGAVETARYLVAERKDVEIDLRPDPWQATALFWASRRIHYLAFIPKTEQEPRRMELIVLLLNGGADPTLPGHMGMSPLQIADTDEIRKLYESTIAERKKPKRSALSAQPQPDHTSRDNNTNCLKTSVFAGDIKPETAVTPVWVFPLPNDYSHTIAGLDVDQSGNTYIRDFGRMTTDGKVLEGISITRKLDPEGRELWMDRISTGIGSGTSDGSVCWDGRSVLYVAGSTSRALNDKPIQGWQDSFVATYSDNGTRKTLCNFGDSGNELISGIVARNGGGAVVAGTEQQKTGTVSAFWAVVDSDGQVANRFKWKNGSPSQIRAIRRDGKHVVVLSDVGNGVTFSQVLIWVDDSGTVVRERDVANLLTLADGPYSPFTFNVLARNCWIFSCSNRMKPGAAVLGLSAEFNPNWAYSWSDDAPWDVAELPDGTIVAAGPFGTRKNSSHVARCFDPKGNGRVVWE